MVKLLGVYDAIISKIIDGDTVEVNIELGFRIKLIKRVRIFGIDAPEVVGENKNLGKIVKGYLKEILKGHLVYLYVYKFDDSFGRAIAEIDVPNHGFEVGKDLLEKGLAWKYKK